MLELIQQTLALIQQILAPTERQEDTFHVLSFVGVLLVCLLFEKGITTENVLMFCVV